MKKPCDKCLVGPCCSEPCLEYAKYVYTSKEYRIAGDLTSKKIEDMPYEKALNYILNIEQVYFYIRHTENLPRPHSSTR